jgi:serine/threonine protein kinase
MSASFFERRSSLYGPGERPTPTTDLESTTDLQGGHTTDLAPATSDIDAPAIVGEPKLERVDLPPTPTTANPLTPGAVLCDRFILERVVGNGGTAVVYQARDMTASNGTTASVRVALKAPRPDRDDRARAVARLQHEFAQASKLSHPNIVRMFEVIEHAGSCFITMELIEGRLLSTIVRDWTMLPRALANKILRSCAQALHHAHENDVVHGDFKPGNVFLTHEEDVKIVDFGASAALSGDSSRIPAGTPAYASPQVLDGETPDRRDDVFSYACVAYELLTGQHPFQHRSSLEGRDAGATPTRAWNLTATQWLGLLSALSWDREQRPADIMTLLGSLLSEAEPIATAPPIQPTGHVVTTELSQELIPAQRGWGFFAFIACAIVTIFIAAQRQDGPDEQPVVVKAAEEVPSESASTAPQPALPPLSSSVAGSVERPRDALSSMSASESFSSETTLASTSPALLSPVVAARSIEPPPIKRSPVSLSEIAFDSASIVTTESSVAAVFLIKRSQPLRGRARVQWSATSGTADAGIDFASNASGSVEFADGQAQRAIYVPLRNDLLKEDDETFMVELLSPSNARLGKSARAEATIRDDD